MSPDQQTEIARNKQQSEYNGWRFLTVLVQRLFDLVNSGKIYPAVILVLLLILLIVAVRLPASEIAPVAKLAITTLGGSKGGLIFLLAATNGGWWYLLKRLHGIYTDEVNRLARIRSELLHGPIKTHRSTDDDCREKYLFPSDGEGSEDNDAK